MKTQPDFIHEFVPGISNRTLLLLHGTGGNEHDLIPLGRAAQCRNVLADIDVRAAINVADDFIELLTRWPKGENLPYHLSEAFVAYRRLEGKTLYTAR